MATHARAAALAAFLATAGAGASPRQRLPRPTPLWAVTQLLPSPEWLMAGGDVRFGLRWQVTPVLFAFALRPGVNPWRTLVAEPVVRYGGSVELTVAPEYFFVGGDLAGRWALSTGLRFWLPLVQRGENLAVSLGASHFLFREEQSVGFEAGACVLFGMLGVTVAHVPRFQGGDAWIVTLRLRYL